MNPQENGENSRTQLDARRDRFFTLTHDEDTVPARSAYTKHQKESLQQDALQYIIPHFASNAELAKGPKIFTRGEGCYVFDIDGNKYFDSFSTLLSTVCGHTRPEMTKAVTQQMDLLEFFPNYVDTFTIPLIQLATKLAQIAPGDLSVSFFVNSGSEANETALKMARQYHVERGERQRFKFIARRDSYHATTLGAAAVTGLTWFREYFEPLMPGCIFVSPARDRETPQGMTSRAYGDVLLSELENVILNEAPELIAGIIMDPLPGSNTAYPLPPQGYLQGVRRLCDKYGILLIFDEVQTGFGKTGKWFFCEHAGVTPDILTIGKGFSGGYMPLGATITSPDVAKWFRRGPNTEFRSGSTYGGHTLACTVALTNIEIIEKERLIENAAVLGPYIKQRLDALAAEYRLVGKASGIGLLWGLMLEADPQLGVGSWIRDWCWQNGMILRNNADLLVLAPSLIITREETCAMLDLIERAIAAAVQHFNL